MDMDVANFKDLYADNERNFRGVDLSGADLSYLKLDDIDFRGAILQYANFQRSTLQRADFRGSDLKGTIFKKANLQYANFEGMNLEYANFAYADFESARLQNSILGHYNYLLHQVETEGHYYLEDDSWGEFELTNFDKSKLINELINFEGADLQFANLKRTILSHANLRNTILLDQTKNKTRNECTVRSNLYLYKREFPQEIFKLEDADKEFFKSGKYLNPYSQLFLKRSKDRTGQREFRQQVLKQYGYRCLITDCNAVQALEAAHIKPYAQDQNNDPSNGLLLRADIHTLFDLNLIAIDKDTKVYVHPNLRNTVYWKYDNTLLKLNDREFSIPNKIALENRYNNAIKYWDLYFQLTIWDACDRRYE